MVDKTCKTYIGGWLAKIDLSLSDATYRFGQAPPSFSQMLRTKLVYFHLVKIIHY